jgi:hypothetical protein
MASTVYKKGDAVRQVVKVIVGEVVRPEIVDDEVQFLVKFVGEDGEESTKYFREEEIEAVV